MQHRWRMICERGQTAVQYAGMVFFAALLAVALIAVATPIGEQVTCKIQSAVAALTGGNHTCGSDPYQVDPSTVVSSSVEQSSSTSAGVSFPAGPGKVSIEGQASDSVANNEYMDGSGAVVVSSTQELSGSYGLGSGNGDGDAGEGGGGSGGSGFEAQVNASGGVAVSHTETETHKCDSPGQPACSEIGNLEDDQADVIAASNRVALTLSAEASVEVGTGGETDPVTGESDPEASAGAGLGVSGEASYTQTETVTTTDTGQATTTSHEFAYKVDASVSASFGVADPNEAFGLEASAEASGSYVGRYQVTYDENGNLQSITFIHVKEGVASASTSATAGEEGDNATVGAEDNPAIVTSTVTTTLDVSSLSPDQRRVAEDYVNSSLTNGALTVPQSALNPSMPSSDAFDNLLYERAKVTRIQQQGTQVTDTGGFDAWILSVEHTQSQTTKDTVRVEQLGRPSGPGGERGYEEVKAP